MFSILTIILFLAGQCLSKRKSTILLRHFFVSASNQKCSEITCLNQGKCVEKEQRVQCICPKDFTGNQCELTVKEFNDGPVRRIEITGSYNDSSFDQLQASSDPLSRAFGVFDLMFDLLKQQFKQYFVEKLTNNTDYHGIESELLDHYKIPRDNVAIIRQLNRIE
jgi:hypothetical protein